MNAFAISLRIQTTNTLLSAGEMGRICSAQHTHVSPHCILAPKVYQGRVYPTRKTQHFCACGLAGFTGKSPPLRHVLGLWNTDILATNTPALQFYIMGPLEPLGFLQSCAVQFQLPAGNRVFPQKNQQLVQVCESFSTRGKEIFPSCSQRSLNFGNTSPASEGCFKLPC